MMLQETKKVNVFLLIIRRKYFMGKWPLQNSLRKLSYYIFYKRYIAVQAHIKISLTLKIKGKHLLTLLVSCSTVNLLFSFQYNHIQCSCVIFVTFISEMNVRFAFKQYLVVIYKRIFSKWLPLKAVITCQNAEIGH